MTVLVTTDGHLLESDPNAPKQTPGGLPYGSQPFSAFGSGHLTLISGRPVSFTQLYRTQPWVAVMVNKLTRQIARLPLKVYRRNSQGERERVYEHRLVDLIRSPAPHCSASQLKQWLIHPALIHGSSTLVKVRRERAAPPHRLWPLDWRFMEPQMRKGRDAVARPIEFWRTYEFGDRWDLDPDDVVHLAWEAADSWLGISPLEQLGVTVRIEASAQEYQEAYLRQGFRPPSAISPPEGPVLDAATRAEMREDLRDAYAGSANAGKPLLLPAGAKWESVAHTAHEAELIEQRKVSREETAAVYDVPPPMAGILERATFANITEQHKMLFTTVLGPWVSLAEEAFKVQVIDPEPAFEGLFVEFDIAEVLRGDKVKEINALKIAVQSGLMTINEARRVLNLPTFALPWCDQPLIPTNNLGSSPSAEPVTEEDRRALSFARALLNGDQTSLAELQAAAGSNGNH